MSEIPQLAELAQRKRMLLATSTLERQVVAVRWEEAEASAQWVEKGLVMAQQVKPWLKIGLPLLAAFRWRKQGLKEGAKQSVKGIGRVVSWVRRGLSVWAVVQQVRKAKG